MVAASQLYGRRNDLVLDLIYPTNWVLVNESIPVLEVIFVPTENDQPIICFVLSVSTLNSVALSFFLNSVSPDVKPRFRRVQVRIPASSLLILKHLSKVYSIGNLIHRQSLQALLHLSIPLVLWETCIHLGVWIGNCDGVGHISLGGDVMLPHKAVDC